jgi:hypothetical protein
VEEEEVIDTPTSSNIVDTDALSKPSTTEEIAPSNTLDDDFTLLPKQLDALFEAQHDDNGGSVRSTILKTNLPWDRIRQESLLSSPKKSKLTEEDCRSEKNKAFDLLDALSRSGSLPLAYSELHVVVAVTHGFENSVMGTVVQDNINPIAQVEQTMRTMCTAIHGSDGVSPGYLGN